MKVRKSKGEWNFILPVNISSGFISTKNSCKNLIISSSSNRDLTKIRTNDYREKAKINDSFWNEKVSWNYFNWKVLLLVRILLPDSLSLDAAGMKQKGTRPDCYVAGVAGVHNLADNRQVCARTINQAGDVNNEWLGREENKIKKAHGEV